MKYLRKFNERLSPETYKKAGQILKDKGKPERGSKLINYHDELTSGFYNIGNTGWTGEYAVSRMNTKFYYGDISGAIGSSEFDNYSVDDLVSDWVSGKSNLSFSIIVEFTKKDDPGSLRYDNKIDFLTFVFVLNKWPYGKDEFEGDYDLENIDLYDFYEKSNDGYEKFDIYLKSMFRSDDFYYFADRKSAVKFKRDLLESIEKNHKNEIMDIFSLIITEPEEWDKLIKSIKDIRINNLYIDKVDGSFDRRISLKRISDEPINK